MNSSTKRIPEIDFGRGLAVFLMMLVHTLWMYADSNTQSESWLGYLIHFIGKGTAAFLFLMGISFIISKNQSTLAAISRGLMILGFAYFMNFLKFVVPIEVFGTMPEAFINAYGWESPLSWPQLRYIFLTGDILQMAGIALILLAIIRHFISDKWGYLVIALLIASVSRELSGYQPGIDGLDYIAKLFFSNHYQVYFPVFPWISFILIGMFFGRLVMDNHGDSSYFFKNLPLIATASLATGGALCFYNFEYHFNNFFHLGLGGFLYLLGINLWLFVVVHKIIERKFDNFFTRFLFFCSERVTSMYVIQWTLVCWRMGLVGFQTLNAWQTALMMPVVVMLTLGVQLLKDRLPILWRRQQLQGA